MSIIKIKKRQTPFVQIDKTALQDTRLSWKAKGILAYLLSLPQDWQLYIKELQEHATDGRDSTAKGINELIKAGYITRDKKRDDKGHFKGYQYNVFEQPQTEKPQTEKPQTEKPQTDNPITDNPITDKPKTGEPITENPQLLIIDNTNKENNNKNLNNKEGSGDKSPSTNPKKEVETKNKTLKPPTKLGETLNEQTNNKKIPYFSEFSEIMAHLTKVTGKKFRLGKTDFQIKKSDKYLKIVARLKEGYTVTDFYNVIGIKCKEWLEDSKMMRFLRPSTLFAGKNFEKYIDEYENQSKTIINYENYQNKPTNQNRRDNRRNGAISQEFSDGIENSLKAFYARTNGDSNGANY